LMARTALVRNCCDKGIKRNCLLRWRCGAYPRYDLGPLIVGGGRYSAMRQFRMVGVRWGLDFHQMNSKAASALMTEVWDIWSARS
jgi:hypothetical protein